MDRSKCVVLLTKIAMTRNVSIPLSEKEIVGNEQILDLCIDDLLASELSEYGFDKTDALYIWSRVRRHNRLFQLI